MTPLWGEKIVGEKLFQNKQKAPISALTCCTVQNQVKTEEMKHIELKCTYLPILHCNNYFFEQLSLAYINMSDWLVISGQCVIFISVAAQTQA